MFNTTNVDPKVTNTIKIQACSGEIYKCHSKSRIVRIDRFSILATDMLNVYGKPSVDGKEIVVNVK